MIAPTGAIGQGASAFNLGDLATMKNLDRGMQAYSLLGGGQGGQQPRLQPPPLYQAQPQQPDQRRPLVPQLLALQRIGLGR